MTPLTHHDILRLAAPLVRRGRRVDLGASDRAGRRILFAPETGETADGRAVATVWSLQDLDDGAIEICRAAAVEDGRVATFAARPASAEDLDGALATADAVPVARQLRASGAALAALDHVLEPADPDADPRRGPVGTRLALRSATVLAGPLRLLVDASPGMGMPADVRLAVADAGQTRARPELASGARLPGREPAARAAVAALGTRRRVAGRERSVAEATALLDAVPDDLLAVAGPGWRVLRGVGDSRRAGLAGLGGGARRSERVEAAIDALLPALDDYVTGPVAWHERHAARRRRVWLARLKPVMTLGAIFAVMPIAWLAVNRGGVELHPLALGLTPLMMVAIIAMSAREVPVMEIPAWPRAPAPLPGVAPAPGTAPA